MPQSAREETSAPTSLVVRGALRIRADRLQDLRRAFGGAVDVIETTLTDPVAVESVAASTEADAIVIDVVSPVDLAPLVAGLRSYTLLRPVFEQVRTSRGERQPVFSGYALLTTEGDLQPIEDGALKVSR